MNEKLLKSSLANRTYLVGGSVRDTYMGRTVTDHDYVIEATEEEFRKEFPHAPLVGNDFPVFIVGGDEVALTRTERSTGKSYGSFELTGVGVPLKDDLGRRDFTFNALAMNIVTGITIDPFGGRRDIKDGVIKMVFEDTFKEDPVRILRALRFVSRFYGEMYFDMKTWDAMKESAHLLENVTKERIALEVEKVWKSTEKPSLFFRLMDGIGGINALKFIFPELEALTIVPAGPSAHHGDDTAFDHTMNAIDSARKRNAPFHVFMAALVHDFGKGTTDPEILPHHYGHEVRSEELAKKFFSENRFSKKVRRFAVKAAKWHMLPHILTKATPKKLIKRFKILRRDEVEDMVTLWNVDHPLTEREDNILDAVLEVIFETDYSGLHHTRVHEAMVTNLKKSFKS